MRLEVMAGGVGAGIFGHALEAARLAALELLRLAAGLLAQLAKNIRDVAYDRGRRDAMGEIVGVLFLAAPVGLGHGALHAAGDLVGIEDDARL